MRQSYLPFYKYNLPRFWYFYRPDENSTDFSDDYYSIFGDDPNNGGIDRIQLSKIPGSCGDKP